MHSPPDSPSMVRRDSVPRTSDPKAQPSLRSLVLMLRIQYTSACRIALSLSAVGSPPILIGRLSRGRVVCSKQPLSAEATATALPRSQAICTEEIRNGGKLQHGEPVSSSIGRPIWRTKAPGSQRGSPVDTPELHEYLLSALTRQTDY